MMGRTMGRKQTLDKHVSVTLQDAIEVRGMSALLHPETEPRHLVLILRCNGNTFTATILEVGNGWTLLLESTQGPTGRSELSETQDAAIVSALLGSLNITWLQDRKEDQ
jgi:hypothetical protein